MRTPSTSLRAALAASMTLGLGLGAAACGDNGDEHVPVDGSNVVDASSPDAPTPDASTDSATDAAPFVAPTPFAVPLSAAGPDQLQAAAPGPGGTFYAAGYAAQTVAGPRLVTLVQLSTTGLVTSFGAGGVATTTIDFRGGGGEVGLGVQPGGKLIVSATIANAVNAADRDVAVYRFNANGTPDAAFGVGGVRILDLNTAHDNNGSLVAPDAARGVAIGGGGEIYVYALQRAEGTVTGGGPRTDVDLAVLKLTADGAPDLAFGGGDGKYTLDIQNASETARGINVLPDGSILASGYANSTGLGSVQPVMVKLSAAGVPVPGFANGGIYHDTVLAMQTEIYNVAVHPAHLVTGGYGRDSGMTNDWVSLRFDLTTGARDTAWGGATNGAVVIDPAGMSAADNCRNAIALPGGKTVLLGSAGPSNQPAQDGVIAILDATGRLDTSYGTGLHIYALGANGNDQFWGAARSGDAFIAVGYKGGGMTQTETTNDDAFAVVYPLH